MVFKVESITDLCMPDTSNLQSTAKKSDSGKPPLSIVPREALELAAEAYAFGAKKYGRNNYKAGLAHTRLLDAALRHIYAYSHGENLDPESGISHIGHAIASLGMLAHHVKNSVGEDDR